MAKGGKQDGNSAETGTETGGAEAGTNREADRAATHATLDQVMDELTALDEDGQDPAEEEKAKGTRVPKAYRPPRRRRLHWHLGIWSFLSAILLTVFVFLAILSVTGKVVVLPGIVAQQIEARLNAVLEDGEISLREVEFGMTPEGRPRLKLVDVGLRDATGLELAQLNGLEGGVRLGALLTGQVVPTHVILSGAQITLRRFRDGAIELRFGAGGGGVGGATDLIDQMDSYFAEGALSEMTHIRATDLTITLEDARSGRVLQITDGSLDITHSGDLLDSVVRFDLFNQTDTLAAVELSLRSSTRTSEASLAARFENVAAVDIAAQSPALAALTLLDAPISGALRAAFDAEGAVSELIGTMQIGSGAVQPSSGATPVRFESGRAYIDYDPQAQRIDLRGVEVRSEFGSAKADGEVFLTEFRDGWPGALIAQVTMRDAAFNPPGMFETPLTIDRAMGDVRLRLNPFALEIGQAAVLRGEHKYDVSGRLTAGEAGWGLRLDGDFDAMNRAEMLAIWPLTIAPYGRTWMAENIHSLQITDGTLAIRKAPGEWATMNVSSVLEDTQLTPGEGMPVVTLDKALVSLAAQRVSVLMESAHFTAPDGGEIDISGSTYIDDDLNIFENLAEMDLKLAGAVPSVLSALAAEPFLIFEGSSYGPDVARGEMVASGTVRFSGDGLSPPTYDIRADLRNVSSDQLISGSLLRAERLELAATDTLLELSGAVTLGKVPGRGVWRLPMGPEASGASSVEGTMELSERAFAEFGVEFPDDMFSGASRASFRLDIPADAPSRVTLRSDLAGLAMAIPGTGWSKPAKRAGEMVAEIALGNRPEVSALKLSAPGLTAQGRVSTSEGGGLGVATFQKLRIGGWFDGSLRLIGRGSRSPALEITGGRFDLSKANFDTSGGGGGGGSGSMPITVKKLDRAAVSESIALSGVTGKLELGRGVNGQFSGTMIGSGGARLSGTLAPAPGGTAIKLTSSNAGGIMQGAGIFKTAVGGNLELILAPVSKGNAYEGEFVITDVSVRDAPNIAQLLSAVSVIGLLEQMEGQGIKFSKVDGRFRMDDDTITIYRAAAVGASMGLSLDGYYYRKNGTTDMQGVLSPLYLFNSLGRLFSPRDGEGLIGFNFTLKGAMANPDIGVNPLSVLTPGLFREIFRREPPKRVE